MCRFPCGCVSVLASRAGIQIPSRRAIWPALPTSMIFGTLAVSVSLVAGGEVTARTGRAQSNSAVSNMSASQAHRSQAAGTTKVGAERESAGARFGKLQYQRTSVVDAGRASVRVSGWLCSLWRKPRAA